MREAKPKTRDEITLFLGGGWFPRFSCCQRRRSLCSPSWTALKERAAASVVKARSPHRSSCRRHATQRRPSTEIRLGVNFALPAHGPSPTTFFVLREAFSSKRDPPEATEWSQYKPHPCLTRGACTDKGEAGSRACASDGESRLRDSGEKAVSAKGENVKKISAGPSGSRPPLRQLQRRAPR